MNDFSIKNITDSLNTEDFSNSDLRGDEQIFLASTARAELEKLSPRELAERIVSGSYDIYFEFETVSKNISVSPDIEEKIINDFERIASHPQSKEDLIRIITDEKGNIDKNLNLTIRLGDQSVHIYRSIIFLGINISESREIFINYRLYDDNKGDSFLADHMSVSKVDSTLDLHHEMQHTFHDKIDTDFSIVDEELTVITSTNRLAEYLAEPGEKVVGRFSHTAMMSREGGLEAGLLLNEGELRLRYEILKNGNNDFYWSDYLQNDVNNIKNNLFDEFQMMNSLFFSEVSTKN